MMVIIHLTTLAAGLIGKVVVLVLLIAIPFGLVMSLVPLTMTTQVSGIQILNDDGAAGKKVAKKYFLVLFCYQCSDLLKLIFVSRKPNNHVPPKK